MLIRGVFVESAMVLIPAITEGILALAAGSVAGVAIAIEKGLAGLIALVINLFAKLIGLGGLSKKVMAIFGKVRKRIDRVINKLLKKAQKVGRKLMGKLGIGAKEKPKNPKEHDEQVKAGMMYLDQVSNKEDKDKNKALTESEAQKVAAKTKAKFPVFTSIKPRNEGGKWVYDWTGSKGTKKTDEKVEPKSLPVEGKVYLVYHHKYGARELPHYQVVLSNGNVYDLAKDSNDKIEIRIFSPLKGNPEKEKVKVKGDKFKELSIDQDRVDKINPNDKDGNLKPSKERPRDKTYQKLVKHYESSDYKKNKLDCFSFSIDFINKVINLKNVQVITKGDFNPEKFDFITEK